MIRTTRASTAPRGWLSASVLVLFASAAASCASDDDGSTGGSGGSSGSTQTGGAGGGGGGSSQTGGAQNGGGGNDECPPTCFVANECVTACGEEPRNYGCCPCPAGTINVFSCPDEPDSGAALSCDLRLVMCERAEPVCEPGEVPSVSGICYGPCVPLESCACDDYRDCPNPNAHTCDTSLGRCAYNQR